MRRVRGKKLFPETIIHKIFEANSCCLVKWSTTGEVKFLLIKEFFASINKIFISGGELGTRLSFYEVLRFT